MTNFNEKVQEIEKLCYSQVLHPEHFKERLRAILQDVRREAEINALNDALHACDPYCQDDIKELLAKRGKAGE